MKNTFGSALTLTLFGESHGPMTGVVLDGLCPGLPVDEDAIRHELDLRRPSGSISTARREADEFVLASGVFHGRTTGTPLSARLMTEPLFPPPSRTEAWALMPYSFALSSTQRW